jgi:acetyl-CoA acetyltransferases
MKNVVIVGAKRTPIGDFLGALKTVGPVELAITAARAALEQANVSPELVQEVACGMIYKEGQKGNPGRQIQLGMGIPVEGWAYTVDQQCASGMKAFELLSQSIMLGKVEAGLAIGTESMSQAPYVLMKAREGYRMGDDTIYDTMLRDGLVCASLGYHMGLTAENVAERYNITREEQDELAVLSHTRAVTAIKDGVFASQIAPVTVESRKGPITVSVDEHPRSDISLEKLAAMKPAFKKNGTVTAGNSSGVNDAACALVLMAEEKAVKLGLKPLARLVVTANAGVEPAYMGLGPIAAVPKALQLAGLTDKDIGYYEINEAFAAQFIGCERELKIDRSRINHNGSGIGLGHPVGCTAARIILAAVYELERIGCRYALASLCVGGGPAMATIVERM